MSIGDLATILTVGGVSIYVLGLIGLAIPIRREFTGDISTAWYAVSLVPKTVVAGQGVWIWMRWTVAFAASVFVLTAALRLWLPGEYRYLNVPVIAGSISVISVASFVSYLGKRAPYLKRAPAPRTPFQMGRYLSRPRYAFTALFATLPVLVGYTLIASGLYMLIYPDLPILGSSPSPFRGIVVLLIGSFFLGLPFAIWAAPPLPKVQITKQPEEVPIEGAPDPLEGWLVAHSDGFWHLFPRFPTDEEHLDLIHRDLISIHDDKALVVRTFGKEVAPAKGPSEADGQRDAEEARPETGQGREAGVSPPEHAAPE
jgi:hypothetical protein